MSEIVPAGPSPFDAIRRVDERGEWWAARELMPVMGYGADWRNFVAAIERAKLACRNTGADVTKNFGDATRVALRGPAAADFRLTRFASYLIAMNGDPRKREIADAQAYFAAKTREAELAQAYQLGDPLDELERQAARTAQAVQIARQERTARVAAETRVLELEPSAKSWDTLASGRGDISVADAAKILSNDPAIKLGRDRLFAQLASYGWVFRQRGDNRWRARQTAIECGRLAELPASHYHPRTGELIIDAPKVRVTIKGLHELHKRLDGVAPLDFGQGDLDLWQAA